MGNVADQRIREGYEFLFAYEVELGFLIGDTNLDKCGVRSLSVFYEMFAALSRDGKSISQKLNEIYEKYVEFDDCLYVLLVRFTSLLFSWLCPFSSSS